MNLNELVVIFLPVTILKRPGEEGDEGEPGWRATVEIVKRWDECSLHLSDLTMTSWLPHHCPEIILKFSWFLIIRTCCENTFWKPLIKIIQYMQPSRGLLFPRTVERYLVRVHFADCRQVGDTFGPVGQKKKWFGLNTLFTSFCKPVSKTLVAFKALHWFALLNAEIYWGMG